LNYLIDTNLLVRAVDRKDRECRTSRDVLRNLMDNQHTLYILPQITAEFWVVCTRPKKKNGLGYTPARVRRYITRFELLFFVVFETEDVYREWNRLVSVHSITGPEAHDTRVVAAMTVHGIENIVTFNVDDFGVYEGIHVIHPQQIRRDLEKP
jgi:predicted nucleic acid-binding protein